MRVQSPFLFFQPIKGQFLPSHPTLPPHSQPYDFTFALVFGGCGWGVWEGGSGLNTRGCVGSVGNISPEGDEKDDGRGQDRPPSVDLGVKASVLWILVCLTLPDPLCSLSSVVVPPLHPLPPSSPPRLTSCPRQSPTPAAWSPRCRCGCPRRTPAWCLRPGFATPRRRCRRSPASPGCG